MAKKKSQSSLFYQFQQNFNFYNKKWVIASIVIIISIITYTLLPSNSNQWTFIADFGIKLPLRYQIHGIDVSHHNDQINWNRLKNAQASDVKIDFVYIKATEGATHVDKRFEYNWNEAERVGMRRGAYHFYNPRRHSSEQAENFIRQVKLKKGDLPPVLDLEITGGKPDDIIIKGVRNWLEIIEKHYRVKPVIYINEHFYKRYIAGHFDDYPLWLAGYSRTHLNDLAAEYQVILWQHSEKGWVDGIKGFVDFNVFLATDSQWKDFGI